MLIPDRVVIILFCRIAPTNIYLFKDINRNTRKRCEVYSKLSLKTSEPRHQRHSDVFIVNLNIFHIFF